ncbi:MAG: tryptophan synthase subunit alpha [candidate division Zixibacteria bacterium]|nr:tryptophan synthase subunit alpha [candidate division Zixibacteria bacterium]
MTALENKFACLRGQNRKALIPFFSCGYPDISTFSDLVKSAQNSGADAIEIGLPFSDPLADGASIQHSSRQALANGITPKRTLELIENLKSKVEIPLVILTYLNPVLQFGLTRFAGEASRVGMDGIVFADVVIEESHNIEKIFRNRGLDLIYLVAPTTNGDRLREIARKSTGFIYLVSVTGVTGARNTVAPEIPFYIRRIRQLTRTPICVGFGISNLAQAGAIARHSDGVIVGSAIIDRIRSGRNRTQILKSVSSFLKGIRRKIDS